MSQPAPEPNSQPSVAERLHEIAHLLREGDHLSPQAQQELARLTDELGQALRSTAVPSAEATHLADSAAHLIESLHHNEPSGTLAVARDRLEQAVLSAEASTPFVAGVARRILDALANLGI